MGGQNLKGFLRIRPVFLMMEPTFESSFFGSVWVIGVGGKVFTAGFLTFVAALAAGLTSSVGLGSSTAGCGCEAGAGTTSGATFELLRAMGITGISLS